MPILARLHSETRALHAQIEHNPRLCVLLKAQVTLADYVATLQRLYGFYLPLETRLSAFPQWARAGFDFNARRKAELLKGDLRALGLDDQAIDSMPRCAARPDLGDYAQALGVMYVLEGATLGGQVLAGALQRRLGIDARSGAAFYNCYGLHASEKWQGLCALLASVKWSAEDAAAAVQAAAATFQCLDNWLSEYSE
ncbi:MAG: biliverdin-producing heme oxygenase [Gammaproteobacteria bacterium]